MGSAVIWQVPGKSARLFVGLDWIHLGLFYGEAGNTTEKKKVSVPDSGDKPRGARCGTMTHEQHLLITFLQILRPLGFCVIDALR